ncbi:MAG: asparagine synthase-related protein [Gammaproteobacteria bacterium]
MIKFRLRLNDLASQGESSAVGWRAGQSYIRPFFHPALEAYAITDGTRMLFVVRERLRGVKSPWAAGEFQVKNVSPPDLTEESARAGEWPLDLTLILVCSPEHGGEVKIYAGSWGTAPVYVLEDDDTLWGNWDPSELYRLTRNKTLDAELVAHFLIQYGCPYSKRTLFPEIQLLTERTRTRWSIREGRAGRLQIEYPTAVEPRRPRTLKPDADVLSTFRHILTASMRRWLDTADPAVSAELSSGLDTGIVAAIGSDLSSQPVQTYGLVMPGEPGRLQQERRKQLIERFRFVDRPLMAEDYPPLSFGSRRVRENRIVPGHELYYEAFEAMLKLASAHGTNMLFNGNGGDELCSLYYEEWSAQQREQKRRDVLIERYDLHAFLTKRTYEIYRDTVYKVDRAPRASMPVSALTSAYAASPLYLRNGIWPVSPLCTPELVRFCRSLPHEWRAGRALQRRFLTYLGCSDTVAYPKSTETFIPVVQSALRQAARPLLQELFEQSRLTELGFVDRKKLLASYAEYCANDGPDVPDAEEGYYSVAVLELTLRALQGDTPPATAAAGSRF